MKEEWKDIPGFVGLYQISNQGRIKSFKQKPEGNILRLTNSKGDYFTFVLQGKGKKNRSVRIHRLVAEAFIPNPNNLPMVNHIDGNKQNNRVENLEWCTSSYNTRHAIKLNPSMTQGLRFYNIVERPKPILQYTKDGEFLHWYANGADASRATGICQRNILQAANGTPFKKGHPRKTAGGYIWRFESEVNKSEL